MVFANLSDHQKARLVIGFCRSFQPPIIFPKQLRELSAEVRPRPVAFALALDQTLNSTLHAVPPVPCFPLLLGIGVVRPERSCGF